MILAIEFVVQRFLAHKQALGRKYRSEACELRLLLGFLEQQGATTLDKITPAMLEDFLASRPRIRPRSFNHLLGVVGCFLDWAVSQQLLAVSPLRTRRRRVTACRIPFVFDRAQARQLLQAAAALPDRPTAPQRGPTYRTIFALSYGLGLRAGEVCGLRLGDVDLDRGLLVVRGGMFGKSRLVPFGPLIGELLAGPVERCGATTAVREAGAPLFTFDGRRCVHPGTASQTFHHLVATLDLPIPAVPHLRDFTTSVTRSRLAGCSAGIGRARTHQLGCMSCRPSSAMTAPPQPRST
jgi:site-specific recombinase XerC